MSHGFAGNADGCTPFSLSAGWMEETRKMLNFYRLLVGLNPIQFTNATMNDLSNKVGSSYCEPLLLPQKQVQLISILKQQLVVDIRPGWISRCLCQQQYVLKPQ